MSNIDHPQHYGGADNPYEVIKVIESWGLGYAFCVGNAIKYICRAPHKGTPEEDLDKAIWYVRRIVSSGNYPDYPLDGAAPGPFTAAWKLPPLLAAAVMSLHDGSPSRALTKLLQHREETRSNKGSNPT